MSIATVIGPTPPGTGVIWLATLDAETNSTSPTRRWPDFLLESVQSENKSTQRELDG